MGVRELLMESFDYDLWATQQWLEALPRFPDPQRPYSIANHILRAQQIWLERCWSDTEVGKIDAEPNAAAVQLHALWKDFLSTCDPTAYVAYTSKTGEAHFPTVEHVALHVVNHGSYHRGQLREIAEQQGIEYPETDRIRWQRQHAQSVP